MWPLSTAARMALGRSHGVDFRVTAYTAARGTVPVPITGGAVTVDASSQVRRSATISVPIESFWPGDDPFAVLSPLGTEIGIEYGIGLADGSIEWVPVFFGPITDASRARPYGTEAITVSAADRSLRVAEAQYAQPTTVGTTGGTPITTVSEITRLITEVLPTVTVTNFCDVGRTNRRQPRLDVDKERWSEAIEKMADSIRAEVYADPLGNFVIRPTALPTYESVVLQLVVGEDNVVVSTDEKMTRERAYSKVAVSAERTDKTALFATSIDDDPTSPTYIYGPFGTRVHFYSSDSIDTQPDAQSIADWLLDGKYGEWGSIGLTATVNPALDAGDALLVRNGRTTRIHVVEGTTIPLRRTDTQPITTRSWPSKESQLA